MPQCPIAGNATGQTITKWANCGSSNFRRHDGTTFLEISNLSFCIVNKRKGHTATRSALETDLAVAELDY